MPTELTEHEVVDALRALRPDVDTPDGWEAEQRARLLTFIETGVIREAQAVSAPGEPPVVPLDGVRSDDRRRGVAVALAAAAAAVVVVGGLVVTPRWRGAETSPATAPPVTRDVPPADEQLLPDVFPILPDDHPLADQATGGYGGTPGWELADQMHAIVAIDDGARLTKGIAIVADPSFDPDELFGQIATPISAAGIDGTLYTGGDAQTLVIPSDPTLLIRGRDPIGFVEASGGVPVIDVRVGADGAASFEVGRLPDGYRAIVAPSVPVTGGGVHVWTRVAVGDDQDVNVEVGPDAYAMRWLVFTDFERVDIDGHVGWRLGRGRGTVIWQAGERAWALLDGPDVEIGLEIARALDFVDRTTWEERYAVEPGRPLDRDEWESGAYTTTIPTDEGATQSPTTMPVTGERECDVIGVEPLDQDVVPLSSEAPVGGVEPFVVDAGASRRIEIDCGAADGVRVGMPVTFESGLIGKITQLADDTSVVMLLGDSQFFVLADVPEAGAFGSVRGSGSDGGAEISVIERDDAESVESGMLVVTAGGERTLAPAGIPIGRIVGPGSDDRSFTLDLLSPSPDAGATVSVVLHVPEVDSVQP